MVTTLLMSEEFLRWLREHGYQPEALNRAETEYLLSLYLWGRRRAA